MKYFKLSSLSFYKNLGVNILFIFEILILLLAVNITLASTNGKKETTQIFQDALTHEGYMIWYYPYGENVLAEYPDYKETFNEDDNKNNDAITLNFYSLFKGDVTVRNFTRNFIQFNDVSKFSSIAPEDRAYIILIILDDDVFEKLGFALQSGSYPPAVTNNDYIEVVITQNNFGFTTGTMLSANDFKTDIGNNLSHDIKISGVLTKNTYLASSQSWKNPMDIGQLLQSYQWIETDFTSYMYISKSSYEKLDLPFGCDPISYIYYNSEPTAEEREYNDNLIKFMKRNGADVITLDEFSQNSQKYFSDISNKVIPIIVLLTIVVLIGLISSMAINTKFQLNNYSVYFLCGADWKGCIKIVISNLAKVSGIALILNIIILQLAEILFNINGLLGLSYGLNNIFVTVGFIAFIIILSCLIPYFIIKQNSPVEIFRKNKV